MRGYLRRAGLVGLVLVSVLIGMLGGLAIDRHPSVAAASSSDGGINLRLISEAWDIVQRHYVDRPAVQAKDLTYGAISGMVNALGDTGHSTFMTPEMVKQERDFTQGEFEGIGAEVDLRDGHVVIAATMDNSPAQRAGVKRGEIILKVDGQDVTGLGLDQVIAQVVGPAGTEVTLSLRDPKSGAMRELTLTRARITVPTVTWQMVPGTTVADIRLATFSERASGDLQRTLATVKQQGATAIVLDMRNNPGGLLDESVGVASQFLPDGNVLQEKDSQGNMQVVAVKADLPKTDLPMVVLIDNGTASAAEIVAGALQDAHRATLMGDKTFGTGTVLNQFSLSDGSAIMLAVQEWLTPDGRTIWHKGIEPDITVTLDPATVPLTPRRMKGLTADQLLTSGDSQLLSAVDKLTGATVKKAPAYWFWAQ